MGKVTATSSFSSVKSWEDLRRFASACVQDIVNQINGKISFNDNIQGVDVNVFFPNANIDVPTFHNLGYVPSGFLVVGLDSAAIIYSNTASTSTNSFLKSSVGNVNAKVRVY